MKFSTLPVTRRISLVVAALVASALTITGVTVWVLEYQRVSAAIETSIAHELGGITTFAPTRPVDHRLTSYLESTYPATGSTMWAFTTDGSISYVGSASEDLRKNAAFPAKVRSRIETGGVFDFETSKTTYRIGVLPIHAGEERAALVSAIDTTTAHADLRELMITYALLAMVALLVVVALSNLIAQRALAPLRNLNETARAINASALTERIRVTGNDDLADLQRTFNAMLDRLEAAMTAHQAMLDDAAHELRTPLTILRGQIELLDSDPAARAQTQLLVLEEVDRMSRLVDDLLVLAKAGRNDFVKPKSTNIMMLVDSVFARVTPLAKRAWALTVDDIGEAQLDEQRIVQALVQLVDNAVKHTTDGQRIELGAARTAESVEFWVADEGTGVPDEERAIIFERFAQGANANDGFGLGLSIVSAIAKAHGGKLVLDPKSPAAGARFRISIPVGVRS